MTDQQKEFLHLCVVDQTDYKTIAQKLDVPSSTLTIWYEELKEERLKIAEIRILWTRKKIKMPFGEFYKWYLSHERKCFYCDITEQEIKMLLGSGLLRTKRIATRGKKLELIMGFPAFTTLGKLDKVIGIIFGAEKLSCPTLSPKFVVFSVSFGKCTLVWLLHAINTRRQINKLLCQKALKEGQRLCLFG
jgi:hypothetical protein